MCLFFLHHSFYVKSFKFKKESMKIESMKNTKKTCTKHEIQKQSLHNQRIEKLSELLKHYVLLKNHFVILSYHQSDVQKALFSKRSFMSFCIQDLDNLNLRHHTRQYHKANIRQVFF